MPKISYIGNQAPVICTACPLRWRLTQKQGTSIHKCAFCYFSHLGLACFAKA